MNRIKNKGLTKDLWHSTGHQLWRRERFIDFDYLSPIGEVARDQGQNIASDTNFSYFRDQRAVRHFVRGFPQH